MEKDIFTHPKGSFERLTNSNYAPWRNNVRRLLRSLKAWDITEGREQLPPLPPGSQNSQTAAAVAARDRRSDFEQRREDAAGIIYNACSAPVRIYIDNTDDPADMWLTLSERLDTASTAVGRQALYQKFMTLRPVQGKPIGDYLASLLEIRNQIAGTPEAISDVACKTHIFTSLPEVFDMTVKIQQSRSDSTVESIIDALKEDERIRMMKTAPDATTEAFHSTTTRGGPSRGASRWRSGRGRGRGSGNRTWCSFCNTGSHTLEDCWSKDRDSTAGNTATSAAVGARPAPLCWHCGESGHRQGDCPVKRRGDEARAGGRKRKKVEEAVAQTAQLGERDGGSGF